jgi:hypothetical protein
MRMRVHTPQLCCGLEFLPGHGPAYNLFLAELTIPHHARVAKSSAPGFVHSPALPCVKAMPDNFEMLFRYVNRLGRQNASNRFPRLGKGVSMNRRLSLANLCIAVEGMELNENRFCAERSPRRGRSE